MLSILLAAALHLTEAMWANFAIDSGLAALLIGGWYLWFRRLNRIRARQILEWIEFAFNRHGIVCGIQWRNASRFEVRLRFGTRIFRRASLVVQLEPREMPLSWLISRLHNRKETITFAAELDYQPNLKLHVQNYRWCGRTGSTRPASLDKWRVESLGAAVISTQPDWQNVLGQMLEPLLLARRSCDLLHVAFLRKPPRFVATAPLQSLRPNASSSGMFEVLHELASSAPASTR